MDPGGREKGVLCGPGLCSSLSPGVQQRGEGGTPYLAQDLGGPVLPRSGPTAKQTQAAAGGGMHRLGPDGGAHRRR